MSSTMSPTDLVAMLNMIVNGFDNLTDTYELEKIKTIGMFLIVSIQTLVTTDIVHINLNTKC